MESLQTIQELKIPSNKLFYDKKSEVLSVYIMDVVFIGNYKKSTYLSKVLDDIYDSFGEINLRRENLFIVDFITLVPIAEKIKLKKLALLSKLEAEKPKKEKKEDLGGVIEETSIDKERAKRRQDPAKSVKKKAK